MAGRGVLYMIWGNSPKYETALERSLNSLAQIHPELPIAVHRSESAAEGAYGLIEKTRAMERSPFEETLLLDIDTVVMGRLDFGFEKARRFGLACCICESPWARRYTGLRNDVDLIEYNTGVLFFTRAAAPVFEAWQRLAATVDSSLRYGQGGEVAMAFNDQCGFAAAIEECGFNPFVLPMNWNYRPLYQPTFFGPIVIWHCYSEVIEGLAALNRHYQETDSPIQMHNVGTSAKR